MEPGREIKNGWGDRRSPWRAFGEKDGQDRSRERAAGFLLSPLRGEVFPLRRSVCELRECHLPKPLLRAVQAKPQGWSEASGLFFTRVGWIEAERPSWGLQDSLLLQDPCGSSAPVMTLSPTFLTGTDAAEKTSTI